MKRSASNKFVSNSDEKRGNFSLDLIKNKLLYVFRF